MQVSLVMCSVYACWTVFGPKPPNRSHAASSGHGNGVGACRLAQLWHLRGGSNVPRQDYN